jgi:hypothetical protein
MITTSIENGKRVTRVIRNGKEWTGDLEKLKDDDRPLNEVFGIEIQDRKSYGVHSGKPGEFLDINVAAIHEDPDPNPDNPLAAVVKDA